MLHALLEAAFVAAQPELDRPDPDPSRVRALGMRAAEPLAAPWSVGIRRVQVRRLLVWVSRTLDEAARDREWRFESAELAFGASAAAASSPAPWPALCVQDTWFAGRLDRLDRSRSGNALRVVDYKRSTVSNLRTRLQLPIYAAAAEANDPRAGRAELGVYVVPRRAGGATGVTEVSFAEASATALIEENIVPVLHQLRTGDVAPRPAAPGECQRCDARGVCRRPPFRVHEGPA